MIKLFEFSEFVSEPIKKVSPKCYVPQQPVYKSYQTIAEYQNLTGTVLIGNVNFMKGVNDEGICKETTTLKGIPVGDKFEVRPDGVYLKAQNGHEEAKRLCNYSFKIETIRRVIKRDGTIQNELSYSVQSNDLVSYDKNYQGNEFPTIAEERYDTIVDDILKRFKECYLVAENKYLARDYLKEFGAIIYREFLKRRDYPVKYVFAYSGWALVKDKNVYLSDNKRGTDYECKCGISVPDVPKEKMIEVWFTDLKILDVGKKIYNVDGQMNYYESWKVILPFWLYLHISFACKLFLDAGVDVQFLMILVGRTGSLKTTLCKTFAEVFNEGGMLRFESTGVAIENYMEKCIDQIMIVDDLFKEDPLMKKKFEVLTRVFGDGVGRAKATGKDYKENIQAKVRGGCIVTAEHSPNAQQSSTLRYVINEIGKDAINTDVLTEFQTDKKLSKLEHRPNQIQTIFGSWIEFLESHYEKLVSWLAIYQQPPINLKFKRHQQMYKVFCAVAQMILQWGCESGAIHEQQRQVFWGIWHTIISELMQKNQHVVKITEPYQQFLMTLQQAIATGAVLIANSKEEFEKEGNRYFGFLRIDKGDVEFVLNPDKTISFVRKHLLDTGNELVSDSTTIWRELFEHGISKGYSNKDGNGGTRNRYFKRIKIHDNQAEMLVLSKMVLENTIEKLLKEKELL